MKTPVFFLAVLCSLICLGTLACSTAPKKPPEVFTQRTAGERQLELANREADRGDFQMALDLLEEARRIAVSADDPSLRIRTGLSRGNILFSLGRRDEASAAWDAALGEAESLKNQELAAACRIYRARGRLLAAVADGSAAQATAEVRTEVNRDIGLIKTDKLSEALGWTVMGLAEKESRRFTEAEAAVKKALDKAIALDRRAENSWGLATDWRAMAEVYRKAGKTAEAAAASERSKEIFESLGIE
jgi:tetratricopeptide (TPR) repeat protein